MQLDAVYTGYLASPRQVEDVCQALEGGVAGPDTLRFVDPAMADGGALYTGFDEEFSPPHGPLGGAGGRGDTQSHRGLPADGDPLPGGLRPAPAEGYPAEAGGGWGPVTWC